MVKAIADLRSLARSQTEMGVRVLTQVATNPDEPASARVAAIGMLLDRGWGKAEQTHTGPDGGDIRVTIRQIIESAGQSSVEPKKD
jgi:hypothetical protein